MKIRCKRGAWRALKENVSGSGHWRARTGAKSGGKHFRIRVCREKNWLDGAIAVNPGCPSETDPIEIAVDIFLRRNDIKEPNEDKLLEYVV